MALADEAIRIGPAPAVESYLRGDVIIDAARRSGAEVSHRREVLSLSCEHCESAHHEMEPLMTDL